MNKFLVCQRNSVSVTTTAPIAAATAATTAPILITKLSEHKTDRSINVLAFASAFAFVVNETTCTVASFVVIYCHFTFVSINKINQNYSIKCDWYLHRRPSIVVPMDNDWSFTCELTCFRAHIIALSFELRWHSIRRQCVDDKPLRCQFAW